MTDLRTEHEFLPQPLSCKDCESWQYIGACKGPESCDPDDDECDDCPDMVLEGGFCSKIGTAGLMRSIFPTA